MVLEYEVERIRNAVIIPCCSAVSCLRELHQHFLVELTPDGRMCKDLKGRTEKESSATRQKARECK